MQLALPLLGSAIAPSIGLSASTGWLVGSMLYGLTQGTKKGRPTIHESGAQTIMEGAPLGIVYGTAPLTGNVIAAGPVRKIETPIKQRKGGSKTVGTEVQYLCTYAVAIGEPIDVLVMAKCDGAIVYDVRPGHNFASDNAQFLSRCKIYYGDEEQLPDPDLEAIYGAGEVPAYRGTSYIVFKDDDLTNRSGSLRQWEFLVSANGSMKWVAINATDSAITLSSGSKSCGGSCLPMVNVSEPYPKLNSTGYNGTGCVLFVFSINSGLNPGAVVRFSVRTGPHTNPVQIWSRDYHATGTNLFGSVQVNHNSPNLEISARIALVGGSAGITNINMYAATPSSTAWQPVNYDFGGLSIVESEENDFGILTNGSSFRCASFVSAGRQYWRGAPAAWAYWDEAELRSVLLSDMISDIHERCGAVAPNADDLNETRVHGVTFSSTDYTGAGAIDAMRPIYHFDRTETDGDICYVARGKPSVATIAEEDLVDVEDSSDREDQGEFPRKLLMTALNPNSNYETSTVSSQRYSPDVRVSGESRLTVPVVMNEEEMTRRVDMVHKVLWAEAEGEVRFSLPFKWIWLTPSDCITREMGGQVRRIRIEEISDSDFVRTITGKFDRVNSYTSTREFVPLPAPEPPVSRVVGDTVLAVMDIPALSESNDALVECLAVSAEGAAWTGAVVQRSLDDGETFFSVDSFGASVIGTLVDSVSIASEFYTDTTNVVRVQLIRDGQELLSISEASFLGGGGAFALEKSDGSFEVMQYLDAEDEGGGVFALTTLHRGQLNSKPAAHATGAKFVLLSGASAVPMESAWIGRDLVHRAPSIGQVPENAAQQTQTYVGRSQLEWPVLHLTLGRDGSDIFGSWVPRHRFGAEIAPVASTNFQGFRVTLDDGSDTITFDTTDTSFIYDASALGTPVEVTVSALNRITGPGEAVTKEIV